MKTFALYLLLAINASGIWACAIGLLRLGETPIQASFNPSSPIEVQLQNKTIPVVNGDSKGFYVMSQLLNESGALNVEVVNDPKIPLYIEPADAALPVVIDSASDITVHPKNN